MSHISRLAAALSPSATLAMSQKSAEMKAQGIDIINMSVGEPDFNTPDFVKQAACRAIEENWSRYSPVAGYASLREAICDKLWRENGLKVTPSQIVVGNGAKQELCNALLATLNPGDEVIVPTPAWVSYIEMVKMAGATAVELFAPMEQDFKITPAQLEKAITPRTRLLMLNSPSNPTGAVYTREELAALVCVLERHQQVAVLSDEVYEHIRFVEKVHSISEFESIRERVMIANGVSKAYAMTGWRIGFLAANADIAAAVAKVQGQYTSGPSSIAQKAAEAAYTGPQECVEQMREAFRRRRDLIMELASQVPGWRTYCPQGAFYIFPDVSAYIGKTDGTTTITSSGDYVMYLLEHARVAGVDGGAFRADGFMRLSFATSDADIRTAMERIIAASRRLR